MRGAEGEGPSASMGGAQTFSSAFASAKEHLARSLLKEDPSPFSPAVLTVKSGEIGWERVAGKFGGVPARGVPIIDREPAGTSIGLRGANCQLHPT
eukprot:gene23982-9557_t